MVISEFCKKKTTNFSYINNTEKTYSFTGEKLYVVYSAQKSINWLRLFSINVQFFIFIQYIGSHLHILLFAFATFNMCFQPGIDIASLIV